MKSNEGKIAIQCVTREIAEKVGKLINNSCARYWSDYEEEFCLIPGDTYTDRYWLQQQGYTIISAEEFLRSNGVSINSELNYSIF